MMVVAMSDQKSAEQARKTVLTGPVTGDEPLLLKDLPMDNVVGALVVLAGEIFILRERMGLLEIEFEKQKAPRSDQPESSESLDEEAAALKAELDAFIHRFWSELSRDRSPSSTVASEVEKYRDE